MATKTSTALKNELANAMEYNGGLKNIGASQKAFISSTRMLTSSGPVAATSASANWDSGALTMPSGSLLTAVNCTIVEKATLDAASVGLSFGTGSAGGNSLVVADADNLVKAAVAIQQGVTLSSDEDLTTAGSGSAKVVLRPSAELISPTSTVSNVGIYFASETTIHGRLTASAGGFKTGTAVFWIEYINLV
jgi:hypothetical protein